MVSKLKTTDILYFGKVNAKTGVSTVLKSFISGDGIFKREGIDLRIFDLEGEYNFVKKEKLQEGEKSSLVFLSKLRSLFKKKGANSFVLGWLLVYKFYWVNANKAVKSYLNRNRNSDIMFFHDFFACYIYLKKRNKSNRKQKIILILHTNGDTFKMLLDYFPRLKNTFVHKQLLKKEKYVLSQINKVGFVSENSSKHFKALHPEFDKEKVFYVHNGIKNIKYNIPEKKQNSKLVLTCAASISDRKGQDIIVEAVNLLCENSKDNILINLLGTGPLLNNLEKTVKEYNLETVINFIGQVSNVNDYLLQSDGFILTSRDEGLPMCIIEAMRVNLPIIATKIAGIPEQVENDFNGYLIDPNVIELKDVLENILDDVDLFLKKGDASRKLFEEKFTEPKMIERYSDVLKSTFSKL